MPALGESAAATAKRKSEWRSDMYQKLLVPLDDSDDSRSVVKALSGLVAEGGEAILLHVIPPGKSRANYGIRFWGRNWRKGNG